MPRHPLRPSSRVTHRQVAEGTAPPVDRPPSLEALEAAGRQPSGNVILVAVRVAPLVTLEGAEDLTERVREYINGRVLTVFGGHHQLIAEGAWPAPPGWRPPAGLPEALAAAAPNPTMVG